MTFVFVFRAGHSRTWQGRSTRTTAQWETLPSTNTLGTKAPTLWSRTARTQSCGEPSARMRAWTTLYPARQKAFARFVFLFCRRFFSCKIIVFLNKKKSLRRCKFQTQNERLQETMKKSLCYSLSTIFLYHKETFVFVIVWKCMYLL